VATEAKKGAGPSFPRGRWKGSALEVGMCWAKSEAEARKTAHKYFRWSVTGWRVQAELPDTEAFEAATKHVTPENVAEKITSAIRPAARQGSQEVPRCRLRSHRAHAIGPEQDYFFDFFEKEFAAALHDNKKAA
jgi:hypothetical protein